MNVHWAQCEFLVVDVEGNGRSPQEIIELAVVHIRDAKISNDRFEWRFRPEKTVTNQATRVHGIVDRDLVGEPMFNQVAVEILTALGNSPVIGHNVAVDVSLLKERLPSWKPIVAIDTLKLARWALPGMHSYTLEALIKELGIGSENQIMHRASTDALATAQLFLKIAEMVDKRCELTLQALAEICASAKDPFFKNSQQDLF